MLTLTGKTAIVSGGSSGIGAEIVRHLSSRGANVVIVYASSAQLASAESVRKSLRADVRSLLVEADLGTIGGPQKVVTEAVTEFQTIDILVNNAAYMGPPTALDAEIEEDLLYAWNKTSDVNCRGTFLLTRAVLKHLAKTSSRIINICSSTSRDPDPNMFIYAGGKGMVETFTRCWARDLPRKYGCTVNAVAPGPIATETMLSTPPEVQQFIKQRTIDTPVEHRLGTPTEIAWLVAMICEEGSRWLNGAWIPVAGGLTLS